MEKFKVFTWEGRGYFLNEYEVEAENDTEAIYLGIDRAIQDGGILKFDTFQALKYFHMQDDMGEYEDEHDYMSQGGFIYIDNNDFQGYVTTENLKVIKSTWQNKKTMIHY